MKHFEKLNYEPAESPYKLPMVQFSTVDCSCKSCGVVTKIHVPETYIDWEKVSEDYRRAYQAMGENFQALFVEAGRVFDAPLKEWLDAKHAHLMMQMEELLKQFNITPKPKP